MVKSESWTKVRKSQFCPALTFDHNIHIYILLNHNCCLSVCSLLRYATLYWNVKSNSAPVYSFRIVAGVTRTAGAIVSYIIHLHFSCYRIHLHTPCYSAHLHTSYYRIHLHTSCYRIHLHTSCYRIHLHTSCYRIHLHTSCYRIHLHTSCNRIHLHTSSYRIHLHTSCYRIHLYTSCYRIHLHTSCYRIHLHTSYYTRIEGLSLGPSVCNSRSASKRSALVHL